MANPSLPDRQSPAFSFYPSDFLVGTATFSLEERGAYITLLSYQWDHGGVPDDGVERARLLNCSLRRSERIWARVCSKFERSADAIWKNKRLEVERAKQLERRAELAKSGHKGAESRWRGHVVANGPAIDSPMAKPVQPPAIKTDGLSSSSSSSSSDLIHTHSRRASDSSVTDIALGQRAGDFCEWYRETHERVIGVAYMGHPRNDYDASMRLVAAFSDQQLHDATFVWLGMEDTFATSGTRTIPKFASRVTRCLELMKQRGIA